MRRTGIALDLALVWSVVLFPAAFMMLLGASSMMAGLMAASVIIILVQSWIGARRMLGGIRNYFRSPFFGAAAVLCLLQAVVVAVIWGGIDWIRFFGSAISVGIILVAAACMRDRIGRLEDGQLHRLLIATFTLMCLMALESVLGPPIFPPITHPRPVFVFIEPSHFAIAFLPFLGYCIMQTSGSARFGLTIFSMALGLLMQSTTLIVGLAFILLTVMNWRQSALLIAACVAVSIGIGLDTSFAVDRIAISDENNNLSNLVLIQGWERAYLAFQATYGIGLGFQQFGVWGPLGDVQELIYSIAGDYLNLYDGGTTASKLVAEFGIVGVLALLWFVRLWWKILVALKSQPRKLRYSASYSFAIACGLSIGVELFVRGVGYMSPGFLFFAALRPDMLMSRRKSAPRTSARRNEVLPPLAGTS